MPGRFHLHRVEDPVGIFRFFAALQLRAEFGVAAAVDNCVHVHVARDMGRKLGPVAREKIDYPGGQVAGGDNFREGEGGEWFGGGNEHDAQLPLKISTLLRPIRERRPRRHHRIAEILFRCATEIGDQSAAFSLSRQDAAAFTADKLSADEQLISLLNLEPGLLSWHGVRIAEAAKKENANPINAEIGKGLCRGS